jgi:hypothetical protein
MLAIPDRFVNGILLVQGFNLKQNCGLHSWRRSRYLLQRMANCFADLLVCFANLLNVILQRARSGSWWSRRRGRGRAAFVLPGTNEWGLGKLRFHSCRHCKGSSATAAAAAAVSAVSAQCIYPAESEPVSGRTPAGTLPLSSAPPYSPPVHSGVRSYSDPIFPSFRCVFLGVRSCLASVF